MFGSLGFTELILILFIVLVIFGAGKLPQLGEGIGKAIKGFKKSVNEADAIEAEAQTASRTWPPLRASGSGTHAANTGFRGAVGRAGSFSITRLISRDRVTGLWKPSFSLRSAISKPSQATGRPGALAMENGRSVRHSTSHPRRSTRTKRRSTLLVRVRSYSTGSIFGKAFSITLPASVKHATAATKACVERPGSICRSTSRSIPTTTSTSAIPAVTASRKSTMRLASSRRSSGPDDLGSMEMAQLSRSISPRPAAIAFDPNDVMYIADTQARRSVATIH